LIHKQKKAPCPHRLLKRDRDETRPSKAARLKAQLSKNWRSRRIWALQLFGGLTVLPEISAIYLMIASIPSYWEAHGKLRNSVTTPRVTVARRRQAFALLVNFKFGSQKDRGWGGGYRENKSGQNSRHPLSFSRQVRKRVSASVRTNAHALAYVSAEQQDAEFDCNNRVGVLSLAVFREELEVRPPIIAVRTIKIEHASRGRALLRVRFSGE
jgi:hypothetical protein